MSEPKIEITKIHNSPELTTVKYTLDGCPMSLSSDSKIDTFEAALNALVPDAIAIKELHKNDAKGYRCNAVSITNKPGEEGDNRKVIISLTKTTAEGGADNLNTSARFFDCVKKDANLLPQKTIGRIQQVVRQAKMFIKSHRALQELYWQDELPIAPEAPKQEATG